MLVALERQPLLWPEPDLPLAPSPDHAARTAQTLPPTGDSLRTTESYSASKATAPRISLDDIEAQIVAQHFMVVADALVALGIGLDPTPAEERLTLCILTLENGFAVVGKSAPLSAANFDAEKGRRFAYEDAIRQIWPLMAYAQLDRSPTSAA